MKSNRQQLREAIKQAQRLQRQSDKAVIKAVKPAIAEAERMARNILVRHPALEEFVMGMGGWFFTTSAKTRRDYLGNGVYSEFRSEILDGKDRKYFAPMVKFMEKWDYDLKLTGTAMRFTATGKKITDW